MAMTAVYTNFCGQIVNQVRDGVNRDIIPDPLGSTAHLVDDTQTKRASYTYTPYGEIESHSGETTPLNFVGTLGYFRDAVNSALTYIRARWYKAMYGRWMTVDPLWPGIKAFLYCLSQPVLQVDPTGLACQVKDNPCSKLPGLEGACVAALCSAKNIVSVVMGFRRFIDKETWQLLQKLLKGLKDKPTLSPEQCCKAAGGSLDVNCKGNNPKPGWVPKGLPDLIALMCCGSNKPPIVKRCAAETRSYADCKTCCENLYGDTSYGDGAQCLNWCLKTFPGD